MAHDSLKKQLGFWGVFSIAAGAMISSGLYVLPGLAFAKAGPSIVLSYALASTLVIPVMLAKAELATAMPKAGGSYFFIERSMGPLAGTFAGFASWFSIALKAAFALVGISALASLYFPSIDGWMFKMVANTACAAFMIVNLLSAKGSARLQVFLVVGLLLSLIFYCAFGVQEVDVYRFEPFVPNGLDSIFAVAGMVFVSYGGLTKVASVAEEVENPGRNLPLGMFLAFTVVSGLYLLTVFITIGILPAEELSGSLTPIVAGAKATMGTTGVIVIQIGALLAFATTANSGILSASRSPIAMSRDGLLPEVFCKVSKVHKTPYVGVLVTGAFIMCVITFLDIVDLIKTASTMMLIMFMLVNLSVIIMRKSGLQNYRPTFKAPFCPALQIATLIIYVFLIFEMGTVPLLLSGGFCLLTFVWFFFYTYRNIDRQSALVYLVERMTAKEIERPGLEDELKQITIERDDISLDRFDHLVKSASVLDIDHQIMARDFFHMISEHLSKELSMPEEVLYEKFLERERSSSTVLEPGLAVPHAIIEGENKFSMVLVRCKEGIIFSDLEPPVRSAFVIVGTRDERNFHLKVLMNIAKVVSNETFKEYWLAAEGEEAIRDVVFLSERSRN